MKVLVLGHTGFVGGWVVRIARRLHPEWAVEVASRATGTDLCDRDATLDLFRRVRPDVVVHCAAFVGGIRFGYDFPADMLTRNVRMATNVFDACVDVAIHRLVQPISNCAYPGDRHLYREAEFWDGPPHESVFAYAVSRRVMVAGARAHAQQHGLQTASIALPNLYGPRDHFDESRSHALGALVRKIVDAEAEGTPEVPIWGTGNPVREWLYVEDAADALVRAVEADGEGLTDGVLNVGVGDGVSIKELAERIRDAAGWTGTLRYDPSKPDGAAHKTMDAPRAETILGWRPQTGLDEGIRRTVAHYREARASLPNRDASP